MLFRGVKAACIYLDENDERQVYVVGMSVDPTVTCIGNSQMGVSVLGLPCKNGEKVLVFAISLRV